CRRRNAGDQGETHREAWSTKDTGCPFRLSLLDATVHPTDTPHSAWRPFQTLSSTTGCPSIAANMEPSPHVSVSDDDPPAPHPDPPEPATRNAGRTDGRGTNRRSNRLHAWDAPLAGGTAAPFPTSLTP